MCACCCPGSLGGQEIHPLEFCDHRGRRLGRASAGWFVNQSNVSSATSAAAMPHEAAAAFSRPRGGTCVGSIDKSSRAIRVDGGYRLTGKWSFASGSRHTTWIGAHSAVQNPDGTPHIRYGVPDVRSFLFLKEKATIVDDWQGAGVTRHRQRHLFRYRPVRARRPCAAPRGARGSRESGPLYSIHSTPLYAIGFCGVTLGLARRMLETYVASPAAGIAAPRPPPWRSTTRCSGDRPAGGESLRRARVPA